jgi:phage/plasmid-like protein (TIGR03299 family)
MTITPTRSITDGTPSWYGDDRRDGTLTVREAYESALDWKVERHPVHVNLGTEEAPRYVLDATRIAIVKADEDKVLGIHSTSYGMVQNSTLLDFAEALKSVGDVYARSAFTLYDDRVAGMLVKLGEDKHFGDRDERIASFLLVTTSHDGSFALAARPTRWRGDCMNGFDWAIKGSTALVTLRHTRKVADYLGQAVRTIKAAYNHYDAIDREIEELLNEIECDRKTYLDTVVPALVGPKPDDDASKRKVTLHENKVDGLVAAWDRPDQANIAGTGWGAVMAVNSFENWTQGVRGTTRAEAQARRAVRGDYPLTGRARKLLLAR